jgi:hypothetical protein
MKSKTKHLLGLGAAAGAGLGAVLPSPHGGGLETRAMNAAGGALLGALAAAVYNLVRK